MKLETINNELRLRSVYKLFCTAWIISWCTLFLPILVLMLIGFGIAQEIQYNGETVTGFFNVMSIVIPFFLMFPVAIVLQAFIFGAFLTFGVWLYSKKRKIVVASID